jgi:hypothetical protein
MEPGDWRAAQIKLQTEGAPPMDHVRLAKNSNNVVFYRYIRAAVENQNMNNKSGKVFN